jgi:hypothetical protein
MSIDETHFSLAEMTAVNEGSLRYDGIEKIDVNGIQFTDEIIEGMYEVFRINYPKTLALEDCEKFSVRIANTLSRFKC